MATIPAAGLSAAGLPLTPVSTDPDVVPGMLSDPIDPRTGDLLSIEQYLDPTDAAVLHQFRLRYRTGTATGQAGHRFSEISHVDDRTRQRARTEVFRLLEPFILDRQIQLERVDLELSSDPGAEQAVGGYMVVRVHYRNVAADSERTATLPLGSLLG